MLSICRSLSAARPVAARATVVVVRAFRDEGRPSTPRAKASKAEGKESKKATIPRAPTAFGLYQKEGFAKVIAENPEVKTFAERVKLVRQAWDSLGAGKEVYEARAAVLKATTEAAREDAKKAKKAAARPMSAFMLYSQDNRAGMKAKHPEAKVTEIAKLLGAAWKALPEDEKALYQEAYKDNKSKWEAKQNGAPQA